MAELWWISVTLGPVLAAAFVWWKLARRRRQRHLQTAREQFHKQREWLEASFLTLAMKSAPRGLEWSDCEFDDAVRFARDPDKSELCAFVGVTIKFDAIEGGGMEDVEAVANFKAATGVFHYREDKWLTFGRTILNLNPYETIAHYHLDHVD
jgi:hypothetical protein